MFGTTYLWWIAASIKGVYPPLDLAFGLARCLPISRWIRLVFFKIHNVYTFLKICTNATINIESIYNVLYDYHTPNFDAQWSAVFPEQGSLVSIRFLISSLAQVLAGIVEFLRSASVNIKLRVYWSFLAAKDINIG